ncbi:MAG: hypothetical protein K0U84_19975 [Actinomycetia bacterium]|nr:hypothetical protein [Actinomycetes bacterium]
MVLGLSFAVVVAVVVGSLVWKGMSTRNAAGIAPPAVNDGVDRTVGLLREKDPVCDEWQKYSDDLADNQKRWAASNRGIPASKWTPEQREIFTSVGMAMTTAADQFESILPKAHNVVIQELMAQTIVYLRAYVGRIPSYVGSDGLIAGVANNFGNGVTYMCSAVPLVRAVSGFDADRPSTVPNPSAVDDFMADRDPLCDDVLALLERQETLLGGWAASDPTIPAAQWSPEQRRINNAAREVLMTDLPEFRRLAKGAEGRVIGDLLATQIAYTQAYADAISDYAPDHNQLWRTAIALAGGIGAACEAQS